jgi:hypothetical protein
MFVRNEWRKLIVLETRHGQDSSFKKFHEPIVFQAAMNPAFRSTVFDEAFA